MKKVSVITVNFNQSYITELLLASISNTNTYTNIEIIVVDNGSKENSVPNWQSQYPGIKFIRSDANLGFAGGNNLGIKASTGDYLFFVNNDTEFTPGLIDEMIKVMEANSSIGMASPKIRYFDEPDTLQYAGFTPMNYYTCRNSTIGLLEKDNGQYDNTTGPTGYAHGAAMMLKLEAIDKAGMMAENFFLYYEEMDWCDHIKKAGYEVWFIPAGLIYHKESVSVGKASGLKEYFMNRNRILFIRRNAPLQARLFFYLYFILIVTPRNLLNYSKNKQKGFGKLLLKAIWWNLTNNINSNNLGYPITR
ncbi:glycosyltransferase family 2 protein [Mucilaginibacter sp. KACC 22063]|uniref:glycosyltransferase family 2 protein n=1 Tax=Mucilaginibacter sp. KACC 22063 TaxID=3025666 RepID=UPI0023667C1C|nr:glycosyltransferase family 2 protein [Mucilaginibacter sp. KACC 22063]WDF53676.1 glycosyltransferase family 2 protein [Mucilaginibacter sp. KACC 22063]